MNLAGYSILEVIYTVDQTVVAKAQGPDDAIVALKYQDTDRPTLELSARWQHEFDILSTIDSPAIIKALDLRRVDNRQVLVLEYFTSANLGHLIQERSLDFSACLDVALGLVDALSEVHRHRLIHGDISSKNVLIDRASHHLKLCDFGLSTRLDQESRREGEFISHGTLEYMSPEQTGRTNLDVDYRSDFYSLGAVLYELFFGRQPFQSLDPMSLLHAQIALMPPALHEVDPALPKALSDVVQRLLAKDPRDRYQSSRGLKADLENCARQWRQKGCIESFELAQEDVPERFCVTNRLYGRARERQAILSAFDRIGGGRAELLLISGDSGIGKSALVDSLYQPVVAKHGHFIRGKCDQYLRNQPFSALIQAFSTLIHHLSSEGPERRTYWKEKLQRALGEHAAAITPLFPSLERILGPAAPLQPLPPAEREHRFHLAFGAFVAALSSKGHPLALFLDDLQWVDLPTLTLLEQLITQHEDCNLLVLGAFRHREVDEGHPLTRMVDALEQSGTAVERLHLSSLGLASVTPLIVDTLLRTPEDVAPLATLCLEKTGGNPFFLKQFLLTLHESGVLHYDHLVGQWQWDLQQIHQRPMTENVVDLMIGKFRLFEPETQALIAVAAHFGNQFDMRQLMAASQQDAAATAALLWPTLQAGLVVPLDEAYKFTANPHLLEASCYRFLHDRVQQAAYSLTPAPELQALQLRTGRIGLASSSEAELEERLFRILEPLNAAAELITDPEEKDQLLALNLRGGVKAKAASAFPTAVTLLSQARSLLPENAWAQRPELALLVHKELTEAQFLAGQFEAAEALYPECIDAATDPKAKIALYLVQVDQYLIQGRFTEALPILGEVLALLGEPFPATNEEAGVRFPEEFAKTEAMLAQGVAESGTPDLEMTNPDHLLQMRAYFALSFASYQTGQFALFFVDACKMVQTTLRGGHGDLSSVAFVAYMTAMSVMGRPYRACYEMGQRAMQLAEGREAKYFRVTIYQYFSSFYQHWCSALEQCFPYLEQGLHWGQEGINPLSAGYCALMLSVNKFIKGNRLDLLALTTLHGLKFLQKSHQPNTESMLRVGVLMPVLALQGKTAGPLCLDTEDFRTSEFFSAQEVSPSIQRALHEAAVLKLAYLFEDAERWRAAAPNLALIGMCLPDSPTLVESTFFVALGQLHESFANPETQAAHWAEAAVACEKFQSWALDCEANFRHKHLLLCAELARAQGDHQAAMDLYPKAIEAAHQADFPACEALAHECCARFWLGRQQPQLARFFIQEAHYHYGRWGAEAKCAWLVERWPQVNFQVNEAQRRGADQPGTYRVLSGKTDQLDLHSLLKASQFLAQEINLDSLLPKMLGVLLENAGAEQGAVLLDEDGVLVVEALGRMKADRTVECQRVHVELTPTIEAMQPLLPLSLVHFVRETGGTLRINSPSRDPRFSSDAYLIQRQPKSVLCLPILAQGKQVALLYLENNLLEHAFTPKHEKTLELLSTQAAISLVNARLYEHLEAKVAKRTEHLEKMNAVVAAINAELARSQEKIAQLMSESPDMLENLEGWVNRTVGDLSEFARSGRITVLAFEGSRVVFYGPPQESLPSLGVLAHIEATTFLPSGLVLIPARGPSGTLVGLVTLEGGSLAEAGPLQQLLEGFAHQFGAALEMLQIRARLHAVEATQAKTLEEFHAKGIATLQVCRTCGRCYDHSQVVCLDDGSRLEVPRALPYRFLSRYRFLRCLGTGGMGAVYAAEDEQLNRLVAIKLIRPELVSETALRLRFEREAQSIAKVHHPGVVTLYDSGSTGDGQLYLIMEHLRGLDVAATLRRFGRATPAQAARFLRQGAQALQAAHRAMVIHRDLKPQNLFLVPHATLGFDLKVLDFGVAKHSDADLHLTRTGLMMGTPQYMAPEQMKGGLTDERTDLYAFASVAYEVLTGQPVLSHSMIAEVLRGTPQPALLPPSSLVAGLPTAVDECFVQALAPSMEARPRVLADWAEALASLLDQAPGSEGWPAEMLAAPEPNDLLPQTPTHASDRLPSIDPSETPTSLG